VNLETKVYHENVSGVSPAVGLIPFFLIALKRELSVLLAFFPDRKVVFAELIIDSTLTKISYTGSISLSSSFLSSLPSLLSF